MNPHRTPFSAEEITGQVRTHIAQFETPRFAAHPEAISAFLKMREAAAADGFDLEPFSSFRDYKTQLRIWNHKFSGKKPLFDEHGNERDFATLNEDQIISHILDWSALPGGSRHQWGTEIDVIDRNAVSPEYRAALLPHEVNEGGVFYPLHRWLDMHMRTFGFFRPYSTFRDGMFPEPWHLSYVPVAQEAIEQLSIEILEQATRSANILGKERVLQRLPEIFERHILNITAPDEG